MGLQVVQGSHDVAVALELAVNDDEGQVKCSAMELVLGLGSGRGEVVRARL